MSAVRDAIAVLARIAETEDRETPAPQQRAAEREVLARAEKRLTAMIARRGIDDVVIATAARWEQMHAEVSRPARVPVDDDLLAMVRATADPAEVPQLVMLPSVIGGRR